MKVAIDTNLLVYAEGYDSPGKAERAVAVLRAVYVAHDLVIPAQVLAELLHVLLRKLGRSPDEVRSIVAQWARDAHVAATANTSLDFALGLAVAHRLQVFDAVILAAASEAGCRLLLTEDMQDGFVWGGVTVVNPFAAVPHPLLAQL